MSKLVWLFFLVIFLTFTKPAQAVCPVCTVAIGTCVGLSRWLGVDDTISGVWIGGLILSLSFWMINWSNSKKLRFPFRNILIILISYIFTLAPLYLSNIIGHPYNTLWGIDKLLLGVIAGSLVFYFSVALDKYLRTFKQEKAFFPYQKVILPVVLLLLASFFFYSRTCK